jgi:hypothetical protein
MLHEITRIINKSDRNHSTLPLTGTTALLAHVTLPWHSGNHSMGMTIDKAGDMKFHNEIIDFY